MTFKMIHENYNVRDLAASLAFYEKALGLREVYWPLPKPVANWCV